MIQLITATCALWAALIPGPTQPATWSVMTGTTVHGVGSEVCLPTPLFDPLTFSLVPDGDASNPSPEVTILFNLDCSADGIVGFADWLCVGTPSRRSAVWARWGERNDGQVIE